jgi:hypothetical protein
MLILFSLFLIKLKKSLTPRKTRCTFIFGQRKILIKNTIQKYMHSYTYGTVGSAPPPQFYSSFATGDERRPYVIKCSTFGKEEREKQNPMD